MVGIPIVKFKDSEQKLYLNEFSFVKWLDIVTSEDYSSLSPPPSFSLTTIAKWEYHSSTASEKMELFEASLNPLQKAS